MSNDHEQMDEFQQHQQIFREFISEAVADVQRGEKTVTEAAKEFADTYDLPLGFVEANIVSAMPQSLDTTSAPMSP